MVGEIMENGYLWKKKQLNIYAFNYALKKINISLIWLQYTNYSSGCDISEITYGLFEKEGKLCTHKHQHTALTHHTHKQYLRSDKMKDG